MAHIKNIQKISNYGIFRNFTGSQLQPFGSKNLIYGWNGSGKSTLSSLFEAIETRQLPNGRFPQADFSLIAEGGGTVSASNIQYCELNVKTFNSSFVQKNINWSESVKGILLISEEKIEEKKELDALKAAFAITSSELEVESQSLQKQKDSISKFLTESSKRTKSSFQVIDTKDTRYFNYNKTKLEEYLGSNRTIVSNVDSILSVEDVVKFTKAAKPEHKPLLAPPSLEVSAARFETAHSRLNGLLKTSATNAAIARLSENSDIQSWVGQGIAIHATHSSTNCEFCGSTLTPQRSFSLEGHFNDAFIQFQHKLVKAADWLAQQTIDIVTCASVGDLYDESKAEYNSAIDEVRTASNAINAQILSWQSQLQIKTTNQFDTSLTVSPIEDDDLTALNLAVDALQRTIKKHNTKTDDFEKTTKANKQCLELHYAATDAKDFDYFSKLETVDETQVSIDAKKTPMHTQKERIRALTNSLSDVGVGAEKFNEALSRFLGRSELTLRFKPETSGYEIIRNNSGVHDGNLSEGEKTAIAFIYFVVKLTENSNKLKETIVVVDDPISSFDSNHLFHAYSFLKHQCDDALQLFVLTHNFNFYKLVRDWFEKINRNRVKKDKERTSFFYVIESDCKTPRSSLIRNADQTLVNYQSEYHYLFSQLYKFREATTLNREESYLTANTSRKLLEAFFAFKYPKYRSDLSQLFDVAQIGCVITTKDVQERIYRFINKYSHSAVIEINDDAAENLQGEGQAVIGAIFSWMKEVDSTHYSEMCALVTAKQAL
jgi:wobble nucleotide-excising tRNase